MNIEASSNISVCRLCLDLFSGSFYSLTSLDEVLNSIIPGLDLTLSKDPVACLECAKELLLTFNFKKQCRQSEERILQSFNQRKQIVDLYSLVVEDSSYLEENNAIKLKKTYLKSIKVDNLNESADRKLSFDGYKIIENLKTENSSDELPLSDKVQYVNSNTKNEEIFCIDDDSSDEFVEEICGVTSENMVTNNAIPIGDSEVIIKDMECMEDIVVESNAVHNEMKKEPINKPSNLDTTQKEVSTNFNLKKRKRDCDDSLPLSQIKDSLISCNFCGKFFKFKLHLDGHYLSKHSNVPHIENFISSKIHYCTTCNYKTTNKTNLFSHIMSKHSEKEDNNSNDQIADEKPKGKSILNGELKPKLSNNMQIKSTTDEQIENLNSALKINDSLYSCHFCPKSFKQHIHLDNHYLNKHKDMPNVNNFISNKLPCVTSYSYKVTDKTDPFYPESSYLDNENNMLPAQSSDKKTEKSNLDEKQNSYLHDLNEYKDIPNIDNVVSNKTFYCSICSYRTINKTHLQYHIKHKHLNNETVLPAQISENKPENSNLNTLQLEKQTGEQDETSDSLIKVVQSLFCCRFCGKSFKQKVQLDGHYLNKHKDISSIDDFVSHKIHYCTTCSFMTIHKRQLQNHIKSKHLSDENIFPEQVLYEEPENSDLKEELNFDLAAEVTINCSTKNQEDNLNGLLNVSKFPFCCYFCGKSFKQKLHLDGHYINKHKDVSNIEGFVSNRVHYCSECNYKTINNFNLKHHVINKHATNKNKIKKKLKMMQCAHCRYETSNRGNLINHVRIHSVLKPYHCYFCPESFCQRVNLDSHMMKHHFNKIDVACVNDIITSKIYTCDICHFATVDKLKYNKHVSRHDNS